METNPAYPARLLSPSFTSTCPKIAPSTTHVPKKYWRTLRESRGQTISSSDKPPVKLSSLCSSPVFFLAIVDGVLLVPFGWQEGLCILSLSVGESCDDVKQAIYRCHYIFWHEWLYGSLPLAGNILKDHKISEKDLGADLGGCVNVRSRQRCNLSGVSYWEGIVAIEKKCGSCESSSACHQSQFIMF